MRWRLRPDAEPDRRVDRPTDTRRIDAPDALRELERLWIASRAHPTPSGGWLGRIRYTLGHALEPRAAREPPRGPMIDLVRLDEHPSERNVPPGDPFEPLGQLTSHPGAEAYQTGVRRVLAYLRAGDAFQVNLAHALRGRFTGDPRSAFLALAEAARPLHGVFLQTAEPDGTVESTLSISPELFLDYDAETGRVATRPMKGTRPSNTPEAEHDLMHAAKDRAELAMIVDLMRNDLGRVCTPGTIRVADQRRIERHAEGGVGAEGAVLQATASIEGVLAPRRGLADLLRATFPPGSVTGAPKIRAMQIIDELEAFDRGAYCGATIWLGDDGRAELAVAIRTATIRGTPVDPNDPFGRVEDAEFVYPVGAGVVIDSDPEGEWRETLVKAGVLGALGAELPA